MDENKKYNKKLVVERAIPKQKKSASSLGIILLLFIIIGLITFLILEKLNYIDFLNFI